MRARYVIAADGASSPIRRRLGIATHGVERIGEYLSILFRADIDAIVGPAMRALHVAGTRRPGTERRRADERRWAVGARDAVAGRLRPLSTLGADDLVDLVRRAAASRTSRSTCWTTSSSASGPRWPSASVIGNVFLVGDAAHRTAPTGGTGMNTAIHSAHNLVVEARCRVVRRREPGAARHATSRSVRPSGERNLLRSRGQLQGVSGVAADLGVVYSSAAVVADRRDRSPAVIEPTAPVLRRGRAPHVWLEADGERLSTLDLFGDGLVLLTGVDGATWREPRRVTSARLWDCR